MPQSARRHIGIVACSAEGAALCYRTICLEGTRLLGPHDHPQVSMHTHPLAEYMHHIERGDWTAVAQLMLSSARRLAAAGAEFLVCPDNTIHQAFATVRAESPLPWLHIAEVVADEAVRRGFRSIGVTGTRSLVESSVYSQAFAPHAIDCLVPERDERIEIDRIIFEQLVNAIFAAESRAYLQRVIAHLQQRGAGAVVLGCTEIPLLIDDSSSPLPTLDSTRLLARAALHRSLPSDPLRAVAAVAGKA
jgi:aspartate racemase